MEGKVQGYLDFGRLDAEGQPGVMDSKGRPVSCCEDCTGSPGRLLDRVAETGPPVKADWALMRKFNYFWPSEFAAPPEFPWLATLVTRKKAWRWVSQFPMFFEQVEYWDKRTIERFIAQTLTEVEPTMSSGEEGDKKCCKPKPKPAPEIDLFPPCDRQGPGSWTESCADEACASFDQLGETLGLDSGVGGGRRCARDCCNGLEGPECGPCYWIYVA
jgi:hypothetical protein